MDLEKRNLNKTYKYIWKKQVQSNTGPTMETARELSKNLVPQSILIEGIIYFHI